VRAFCASSARIGCAATSHIRVSVTDVNKLCSCFVYRVYYCSGRLVLVFCIQCYCSGLLFVLLLRSAGFFLLLRVCLNHESFLRRTEVVFFIVKNNCK
jgi:hypothetical protein